MTINSRFNMEAYRVERLRSEVSGTLESDKYSRAFGLQAHSSAS